MRKQSKPALMLVLWAFFLILQGCGSDADSGAGAVRETTTNLKEEPGILTLRFRRLGRPLVGARVAIQDQSNDADLGSGLTDATGVIRSTRFLGTAVVTVADEASTNRYMYTMRDLRPGSDLAITVPVISASTSIGSFRFITPQAFAGATKYIWTVLNSPFNGSEYSTTNLVPNAAISLNVGEGAADLDNHITVVLLALATNAQGLDEIKAYSVFKDVAYARPGDFMSPPTPAAWQTAVSPVILNAIPPTGEVPNLGLALVLQGYKDTSYFAHPTMNASTTQIRYVLPSGFADEFVTSFSLRFTGGMFRSIVRRSSSIQSTMTFNMATPTLGAIRLAVLDSSNSALGPVLSWNITSPVSAADAVHSAIYWNSAGVFTTWYLFSSPESAAGRVAYPKLPALFSSLNPSGQVILKEFVSYMNFSAYNGYYDFIQNQNLLATGLRLNKGNLQEIETITLY